MVSSKDSQWWKGNVKLMKLQVMTVGLSNATLVRNLVGECVKCCLLRRKLGKQIMADLPNDRTFDGTPFTNCEVGMFGILLIKEGRR